MRFLIVLMGLFCCFEAKAQVFAPNSGVGTAKVTQESAVSAFDKAENKTEAENANAQGALVPAQADFKAQNEDKKYDNRISKVVEFKVVNGKIEFKDSDERKILVYTENYKAEKGIDGIVRCSLRVYVLNDMLESLNNLSFKLIWPEISTSVQMVKVNPGVRTYSNITLLGNGCFSMDKTPTIEVNRCRVKGKTQEECANAVHWFPKK